MSSKPSKTVDLLAAFLTSHFVALHMILIFLVAASGKTFNSPDLMGSQDLYLNPDPDLGGQK
jgi:hypothetical protein